MILSIKKYNRLLVFALLCVGLCACQPSAGEQNMLSVDTVTAKEGSLYSQTDIVGILAPVQTSVISVKSAAVVDKVNVQSGAKVWNGDTILTLDNSEIQAEIDKAQAAKNSVDSQVSAAKSTVDSAQRALDEAKKTVPTSTGDLAQIQMDITTAQQNVTAAQKELEAAKKNVEATDIELAAANNTLEKYQRLYNGGAATEMELTSAKNNYESAKNKKDIAQIEVGIAEDRLKIANSQVTSAKNRQNLVSKNADSAQVAAATAVLDNAKAQYEASRSAATTAADAELAAARRLLDTTNITAGISGYVMNLNINPGEAVVPGDTLATIVDISMLTLKGTVPHELMDVLHVGDSVEITVDSRPGKPYTGTIISLSPVAVGDGNHFPIEIQVSNLLEELYAGLSARAVIATRIDGVVVPKAAVLRANGEDSVFVIRDGVASRRQVTLGAESGENVIIQYGVALGEKIATANTEHLFDGMNVNAVDVTPTPITPPEPQEETEAEGIQGLLESNGIVLPDELKDLMNGNSAAPEDSEASEEAPVQENTDTDASEPEETEKAEEQEGAPLENKPAEDAAEPQDTDGAAQTPPSIYDYIPPTDPPQGGASVTVVEDAR